MPPLQAADSTPMPGGLCPLTLSPRSAWCVKRPSTTSNPAACQPHDMHAGSSRPAGGTLNSRSACSGSGAVQAGQAE